jgi:hypothetical protein
LANGKNTGRGGNPSVADDNSAIVKGGFRMEDRQNDLDRKIAIDDHAGFLIDANRRIALQRDECTELFVRQLRYGLGQIVHRFAFFAC